MKQVPNHLFKFILLFIAGLNPYSFCIAQNLIANPSFEQINYCCEYGSKCAPKGWFNTNLTGINSAIFVERARTDFGKRCIQLRLYDAAKPHKRQYVFTPLLCTLVKGEAYYFSVWVRADFIAVKELHVILGDTMFVRFEDRRIEAAPSITLRDKKKFIYNKKGKWINLTGMYTASGNERYLTMGYLNPDEEIESKQVRNGARYAFVSIDSISLVPLHTKPECDLAAETKKYFSEGRRHFFNVPCGGDSAFNLFPFLLKDTLSLVHHTEAGYIEERQTRIWRNLVFDFDKSDLLPQSYPVIDSLVDDMLFNPEINVTISGHTDNSGNAAYNLNLSTQRARSVGVYMMEKGINQSRIKWQGMGDKQPLADNSTELGRATNRRVEFEFYTNP